MVTQNKNKILLVRKRTKWELDLAHYGSESEVKSFYKHQFKSYDRIYNAHIRQINNFEKIKQSNIEGLGFIHIEDLVNLDRTNLKLLISFGGDNHFVYNSRFAFGIPILGINSDTETSTGALLNYDTEKFIKKIFLAKSTDDFLENIKTSSWSSIHCNLINDKSGKIIDVGCSISEFSLRSAFPDYMSSFVINKNNVDWVEVHCSGYLLSTGAGSSGWYCNAHRDGNKAIFPKDSKYFKSLAREVDINKIKNKKYIDLKVEAGETLEIISDIDGEICIDAHPDWVYPFSYGSKAIFKLAPAHLKVVL